MKSYVKLKPCLWDGLVAAVIVLLALVCAGSVLRRGASAQALTVIVSADGTEVDRFAPAELAQAPRTYSSHGYTLTLSGSPSSGEEGVCVSHADCPTQDCVHTGVITRPGQSIVCLPARIVVELEGSGESSGVDVVIG